MRKNPNFYNLKLIALNKLVVTWVFKVSTCSELMHVFEHLVTSVCLGGKSGNAAELFERVSQSVKMKRYSEALDDLNAAIEADSTLSEAYWHRASILRQICRFFCYQEFVFVFSIFFSGVCMLFNQHFSFKEALKMILDLRDFLELSATLC